MKKLIIFSVILLMVTAPLLASAKNECTRAAVQAAGKDHFTQFPKCVSQIYIWSLGIAGVLALLMATAGAFAYMTASGNAERATKGSEMIWGSVIGLALLFGAYLLLNTINPNLTNFNLEGGACIDIKDGKQLDAKEKGICESKGGRWYWLGDYVPPATPAPHN